jgi:hypothetical protein
MNLQELFEKIEINQKGAELNLDKQCILLPKSSNYIESIRHTKSGYFASVVLDIATIPKDYTKEQVLDCINRISKLSGSLNKLELGIKFNHRGEQI